MYIGAEYVAASAAAFYIIKTALSKKSNPAALLKRQKAILIF